MLEKPNSSAQDELELKRQVILNGAMALFMAHGFRRVTMEDIAQAASMSRPSLYLVFRNKTDIYRALAEKVFEECSQTCNVALNGPGTLSERLNAAIETVVFGIFKEIENTPHGPELMDLKSSLASDLIEQWMTIVARSYADAIEADVQTRGIDLEARGLTAMSLATTLMCAVDGAKQCFASIETRRAAVRDAIRIVELAIA